MKIFLVSVKNFGIMILTFQKCEFILKDNSIETNR